MTTNTKRRVKAVYQRLLLAYGPQRWWPADTPYEVCVGAILTQSTSWANVENAVANLKKARLLSNDRILKTRNRRLAGLIRPSLYYNVKARKLREFARFLAKEYGGRVENMALEETGELRRKLLAVWGLGPETADSMLLYALDKPSFVVDAYTKRIFTRMGLIPADATYDEVKGFFETNLPRDARLYNEYHALIVEHGKNTCKMTPRCKGCCLKAMCRSA